MSLIIMDFIGYFKRWKLVNEKKVPEKVFSRLQRKIDEEMYKKIKKKKTTISGTIVHDESERFFYKAVEPSWRWVEKDKRFTSTDKLKIYRKPKKK